MTSTKEYNATDLGHIGFNNATLNRSEGLFLVPDQSPQG
jgi:hypothetical protein